MLNCVRGKEYENEIKDVLNFYSDDLHEQNLRYQLTVFSTIFECNDRKVASLKDIVTFVRGMIKRERILIKEIVKVVMLVLVMPATNATSERSFSALRRIKTYLRSTMTQSRLNSLMVMHVHKEMTDDMDLLKVCQDFAFTEHRHSIFGKFK